MLVGSADNNEAYKVDSSLTRHIFVGSEDRNAHNVDSSLTKHDFVGTADKDRCRDDDVRSFGRHVPV